MQPNCKTLIYVFFITAAWDVVLRMLSLHRIAFMGVENMAWVKNLRPYFEHHTVLSAALIAGFVGAVTLPIITTTNPFRRQFPSLLWVALISALVGLPMRYSGLFPYLTMYYYEPVPTWYSMLSDANSGVVVALTYHALLRLRVVGV